MLKPKSLFADKYGIIEHIGRGGMADVYKVQDIDTKEIVALKVLKAEYAENKTFIERFREEGRAAASLDNDNIVRIYDIGRYGKTYFLVMEYVDGITLKEYIRRKGMLSSRETMAIAGQVAVGLKAAHAKHIVHRDVKPQNIILSRNGKVKVTDFGIARAVTEETKALNANTMGSVHYIAPEQAKGQVSDERSDLYSLGICMYEMITGRVPFDKETSVAVALAHMNETMLPPSELNPDCPVALEQIIFRCTQKSRERRYHNAQEFLQDLKVAVSDPSHDFEKQEQADMMKGDTQVFSAAASQGLREKRAEGTRGGRSGDGKRRSEEDGVRRPGNTSGRTDSGESRARRAEAVDELRGNRNPRAVSIVDHPGRAEVSNLRQESVQRKRLPKESGDAKDRADRLFKEDKRADGNSTFDKVLTIIEIAIGAICLCMIIYLVSMLSGCVTNRKDPTKPSQHRSESGTPDPEETRPVETINEKDFDPEVDTIVPEVKGMTVEEAEAALKAADLECKLSKTMDFRDDYDLGLIYQQSIDADTMVKKGTLVYIWMSSGSDKFTIKSSYIGGNIQTFNSDIAMHQNHIEVIYKKVWDDHVPANQIISLEPSSGVLKPGDKITVTYCVGPNYIAMPNLIGMTTSEAYSVLNAKGFDRGEITWDWSDEYDYGLIIWQEYDPGTPVYHGSDVDYVVSQGPRMVEMPDLVGMMLEDAEEELADTEKYGFTIHVDYKYIAEADITEDDIPGSVVMTTPAAKEEVRYSGEVTLTVLRSKSSETVPELTDPDGKYYSLEELKTLLEELHFIVDVRYDGTMAESMDGAVAWLDPESGKEAPIGSTIRVYVFRYNAVPVLEGRTVASANQRLTAEGFGISIDPENLTFVDTDDPSLDNVIISTNPGAGASLPATGSKIGATVYRYQPASTEPSESESASESGSEV